MKTQRQAKIMEIISTRDIETQEQLLQALQDEGFYSTQGHPFPGYQGTPGGQRADVLWHLPLYRLCKGRAGTFSARLNTIFRECITSFGLCPKSSSLKRCPAWPQRRPLRWMR